MAEPTAVEKKAVEQETQSKMEDPKSEEALEKIRNLAKRQDKQYSTGENKEIPQGASKVDSNLLKAAKDFIQKIKEEKSFEPKNCEELLDSVKTHIKEIKKQFEKYSKFEIRSFEDKKDDENFIIWKAFRCIQTISILLKDCSEISDTEMESLQSVSESPKVFSESICEASNKKIDELTIFNKNLKRCMRDPKGRIHEIADLFNGKEEKFDQMVKKSHYSLKDNQEKLLTLYATYLILSEKAGQSNLNYDEKIQFFARIASNPKKDSEYKNIRKIITPYVLEQIMKKENFSLSYDEEELLEKEIERIRETRDTQKLTSFQKKLLEYEIERRSKSNSSYDVLEDEDLEELKVLQRKLKKEEKSKNLLKSAEKKSQIMSKMLEKSESESSDESIVVKENLIKKIESFIKNSNKETPKKHNESSEPQESKHKKKSQKHSKISKKSEKQKHHSKGEKYGSESPKSGDANTPTIQEYVEVIHYLSQQAQSTGDENLAKVIRDRKEAISESIELSSKETEVLSEKCADIYKKMEEEELDKNEDWDLIDENDKKFLNFQENVIKFRNEVRLLNDKKLNKEFERQQREEKEKKEKEEKERIENFSSRGVEENKKLIEKATEFKNTLPLDTESAEIVEVEGIDYSKEDEDYEHAYEPTENEDYEHSYELAETEESNVSSGKKGFFSKFKSKIKKPNLHKKNSISITNIDDLIKEYDINTMLKDGPKNIKIAANFVLSENKKNSPLLKAMKLLLNDINIVENEFSYFSPDSSTNLNKLKFIERMENCVKRALYSLGEIDKNDDNLKKIFILFTSFLREKEDKEINMMKIMDDRNKFNEKINEENYLNYKVPVRERALIKKRSKRLFKERLQNKDSDDPRIKRFQELERAELEEEALSQKQEHEKDSRSEEATMSPEEKISEKKRSIEIFCRCLAMLLPKDQKKLKVKYLTPTHDIYHSLEPNVVGTFDNYNFKIMPVINEIRSDAESGLSDKKIKDNYIEIFDKNIKNNKTSAVLSKSCKLKLEKLCKDYLINNVSFRDILEDDNDEVLRKLR